MGRLEILKEIKGLIFSEEKEDLKFVDAKAGEMIVRVEADEFEEGLPLLIITEDGPIPAGAGEHLLDDGRTIVTDDSGLIVEIKASETLEEEEPIEEKMEEEAVVEEEVKEEVEMTEDVKEEIKEEIKEELAEEVKEDVKEKVEEKLEEEKPEDEVVVALTERIEKLEKDIEEMLALTKETAQFSSHVKSKLETFVDETPAKMEFTSIKSTYKPSIEAKKATAGNRLTEISKIRKK